MLTQSTDHHKPPKPKPFFFKGLQEKCLPKKKRKKAMCAEHITLNHNYSAFRRKGMVPAGVPAIVIDHVDPLSPFHSS